MPKYTINIADIDINVLTDESPEMVDTLVGIIDRRIREIIQKSPRCSKSEAAILCALDYCAERIKSDNKTREMERDFVKISKELESLKAECNALQADADNLRRENKIMNDIIAKATAKAADTDASEDAAGSESDTSDNAGTAAQADAGEQMSLDTAVAEAGDVPATAVMFDSENAEESEVSVKKATRRSTRAKNSNASKSKMFDTLTFREV